MYILNKKILLIKYKLKFYFFYISIIFYVNYIKNNLFKIYLY